MEVSYENEGKIKLKDKFGNLTMIIEWNLLKHTCLSS